MWAAAAAIEPVVKGRLWADGYSDFIEDASIPRDLILE